MNLQNLNNKKWIEKARAKRRITREQKFERLALELNSVLDLDFQISVSSLKEILSKK